MVSDVFLDNPAWSGNNTTLAAIDCYLPIVTLPTGFMRGRHSYAILRMLGMDELIASTKDQYVKIASRLGNDDAYRFGVRQKISNSCDSIYEDIECVRGLEKFYCSMVEHG